MRNFAFYLAFGAAAFVYGLVFDAGTPVSAAQPESVAITTTSLHSERAGAAYSTSRLRLREE